ncbi:DEAD/DEAH box helicase [Leifsonia sp. EB34]|uniref:DEAD/DEAH box helicase n=1 Tax=Leifsonia sp. EB34 TaxID=3156303 RepID=UPI0035122424
MPDEHHLKLPEGDEPSSLLLSAVATLGDSAAHLSVAGVDSLPGHLQKQLELAARYFDALLESRYAERLTGDLLLLAGAAYYLAGRPGSSRVLAERVPELSDSDPLERMLDWILKGRFRRRPPEFGDEGHGPALSEIARHVNKHFIDGTVSEQLEGLLSEIQHRAYKERNSRDVLLADLIAAVLRCRLAVSVWSTIPKFSDQPVDVWQDVLSKPDFPTELWPAQRVIGQAGLLRGRSGAVLMPTSAGKTKSVEILVRSGFISKRVKLAVVVAPFRALVHEISVNLRRAFRNEAVRVNELSDALQLDFDEVLERILGSADPAPLVLVVTPEKLHFVLRQMPDLAGQIGLLVYDECHQFDNGPRGATYELLLTEIADLVPEATQSVLISAVMPNVATLANWALPDDAEIVDGSTLLPTERAVAFSSWTGRQGRLEVFDSEIAKSPDYFVPRAIEVAQLEKVGRERKVRSFPARGDDAWKDVSLYLGLRLVASGGVAIFCGRKDTANGMVRRAVDVYRRGFGLSVPADYSDGAEVERLKWLTGLHFGADSDKAVAAGLGVFAHHGSTPHGLRVSIEHAMQHNMIRFVVCTSTLAQGVNLPIRYLVVSSTKQAGEDIRTRDFQNLLGRAGRAGMHTEGMVVFGNPSLYDQRFMKSDAFDAATDLLSSSNMEDIGSSLLETISPLKISATMESIDIPPRLILEFLFADEAAQVQWAEQVALLSRKSSVAAKAIIDAMSSRLKVLETVESHLMAMRGSDDYESFRERARLLSEKTLAFALASESERSVLADLFERIAGRVNAVDPRVDRQAMYARTLLSAVKAKRIFEWVDASGAALADLSSPEEWLAAVWPLFVELCDSKLFRSVEPADVSYRLALSWIAGDSYEALVALSAALAATKPRGKGRQRLAEEDVISFCQQTLSFECSLVVAAVAMAMGVSDGDAPISTFLKSLKYGLPAKLPISIYESGLADRALSIFLVAHLEGGGFRGDHFTDALTTHRYLVTEAVSRAPSFFTVALSHM